MVPYLGKTLALRGFTYLPRQDGKKDGIVYRYAVSVSPDEKTWSTPVSQGAFSNINPIEQSVQSVWFDQPQLGRYVKFDVLETTGGNDATVSTAELGVLTR